MAEKKTKDAATNAAPSEVSQKRLSLGVYRCLKKS